MSMLWWVSVEAFSKNKVSYDFYYCWLTYTDDGPVTRFVFLILIDVHRFDDQFLAFGGREERFEDVSPGFVQLGWIRCPPKDLGGRYPAVIQLAGWKLAAGWRGTFESFLDFR